MSTARKCNGAELPDGWRMVRLGEVAQVDTGGTPSREVPEYWGGEISWMASAEVSQKRVSTTAETISEKGLENSNAKIFPFGTIMVAMNGQGSTRGKASILEIEAACNQSLAAVRSKDGTNNTFLFHVLTAAYDRLRGITGEGRNGLNLELVRGYRVCLPPPPEQRAIADVLDSIDDAIERTEAIIAATETLRDSLLHELLTRGVPGWHTEWKDVPGIGTIPADWEVARLGNVCEAPEYGATASAQPYNPQLPRYVRITDLTDDGRLRDDDLCSADPAQVNGYELRHGDLLFARSGATVGKSYLYHEIDGPCVYAGYLIRFRPVRECVLPEFLELITHSQPYYRWVGSMFRAGAQPNINAAEYASMMFCLPPLLEQRAITSLLKGVCNTLDGARTERDKTRVLRQSVGDQLLSGRRRIPVKD